MASVIEGNSEAGFIFASMIEFIHLWRSGKDASMSLKCRDGKTFVNFECSLGHPDTLHIQDGRSKKKYRVKSDARKARNNARAASFQSTKFPPSASTTSPSSVGQSPDPNEDQEKEQLSAPELEVARKGRDYCQSRPEFNYNTQMPFSATQEESETENSQASENDKLPYVVEYQNYMAANVDKLSGKEALEDRNGNTEPLSAEPGGCGTSSSVTPALKQKYFEELLEHEILETSDEDNSKTEPVVKGSHSNGLRNRDTEILLETIKAIELDLQGSGIQVDFSTIMEQMWEKRKHSHHRWQFKHQERDIVCNYIILSFVKTWERN